MDYHDERRIQEHVRAAVSNSLVEYFAAQDAKYKADREADRKARKKGIKKIDDGWTERYPLQIVHYATVNGRNARISIDGCDRSFEIYQNANRPLFNRYSPKKKVEFAPEWLLRMHYRDADIVLWEYSSEDFDSLVQQAVVMLMGHAFMEGSL